MKKLTLAISLLAAVLGTATAAEGNVQAGKTKAAACAACHGADGNSSVAMYPKLAGQHAKYIEKQLHDFKAGMTSGGKEGRNNAIMGGMAMGLSEQDMKDLAAYYAAQHMTPGATPEAVVEAGKALYTAGDKSRGIPACTACHGPRGNGMGLAGFPKISFQHPDYIKAQLKAFRDGSRSNDLNGMMRDIAAKLTDKDIDILAAYLAGLH